MSQRKVNIAVADNFLDQFPKVVQQLKDAGLRVEQALESTGVISGSIEATKLGDLEKMEGVTAIESSRNIQLPPSESDIQ